MATITRWSTKQDWALAAAYRLSSKRGYQRSQIEALLTERLGLPHRTATLLAGHWLTTEPFRARLAA